MMIGGARSLIYNFEIKTIMGDIISFEKYKGNVLLIVNTASECGFTPQFKELQSLYEELNLKGFVILGFPCNQFGKQEPGNDKDIQTFCKLKYSVSFPMFAKVNVNGSDAHPLFNFLTEKAPGVLGIKSIKWNFTKFLIDRSGNVIKRYAPTTHPIDIKKDIVKIL